MMKTLQLLAFLMMIAANYLANALPLNGKTTGQLSALYPNLFVPAGITFSIWGLIYLLLLVYIVRVLAGNIQFATSAGWLFVLSCMLNAAWIFAWHYQKLPLSVGIMLMLLFCLFLINRQFNGTETLLARAAFGIYLGWICIATIANITALLVSVQWNGFGFMPETWAIAMIFSGAVIAMLAIYKLGNPFLGLAVAWALLGIFLNRYPSHPSIWIAATVAGLMVLVYSIWMFIPKAVAV